jgi:hypothetical protein
MRNTIEILQGEKGIIQTAQLKPQKVRRVD